MKSVRTQLFAGVFLSIVTAVAWAQTKFPTKPIRFVVPFAPGGSTDILARVFGERLGQHFDQQVIVDNRPGGGGTLAAELVTRAPPDGHTIFLGSMSTQAMNGALYQNLSFDPIKDFAPISLVASSANLLLVHPSLPVNSVKQLIVLARQRPGQLSYASAGAGSFNYMSAELFKMMSKTDIVNISYRGGAPALTGVMSGETDLIFINVASGMPYAKSGRLKALAVCSARRHPMMPNLPTASESGLPSLELNSWYGILAPAKTGKEIVNLLNNALVGIIKAPATVATLANLGLDPQASSPEEFRDLVVRDAKKWGDVIKAIGAKAE